MSARHLKSAVIANQQMSSVCVMLYETTLLFQKRVFLNESGDSLVFFLFFLIKAFHGSLMDLLISAEFIGGIFMFIGRSSFDFLTNSRALFIRACCFESKVIFNHSIMFSKAIECSWHSVGFRCQWMFWNVDVILWVSLNGCASVRWVYFKNGFFKNKTEGLILPHVTV